MVEVAFGGFVKFVRIEGFVGEVGSDLGGLSVGLIMVMFFERWNRQLSLLNEAEACMRELADQAQGHAGPKCLKQSSYDGNGLCASREKTGC